MTQRHIFFQYEQADTSVVESIYDALIAKLAESSLKQTDSLKPWMDIRDMTPGRKRDVENKTHFESADQWILFTPESDAEKVIAKVLRKYKAPDHAQPSAVVYLKKEPKTGSEYFGVAHRDVAPSVEDILKCLKMSEETSRAHNGETASLTITPKAALFIDRELSGQLDGATVKHLPSFIEAFHWAYKYRAETITSQAEHEIKLEPWFEGIEITTISSVANLAQLCRDDLQQERLEEAQKKAQTIRQMAPRWEMGWFIEGMIALRSKTLTQARFYFQVALQQRPQSFLCAYYSAVSLLWAREFDLGCQELEAIFTQKELMEDFLAEQLQQYPKNDSFLSDVGTTPQEQKQLQGLIERFGKFDLNNYSKLEDAAPAVAFNPMPLSLAGFLIENFQRINQLTHVQLAPHHPWIFLTGNNGEGKSSILQALAVAFFGADGTELATPETCILVSLKKKDEFKLARLKDTPYRNNPATILGYGPARLHVSHSPEEYKQRLKKPAHSLVHQDGGLLNIEEWFKNQSLLHNDANTHEKVKETIEQMLKSAKAALVKVMPMVDEIKLEGDEVLYREHGIWIPARKLSAGHLAIRALVGDMIIRLLDANIKNELAEVEGIVLIDELENHLHVQWQYKFPALLSEIFPKVQFIVSTHSPIPLLGAPENALVLLVDHDQEGQTTLEEINAKLNQMRPNNILSSPIFGLNDFLDRANMAELRSEEDYQKILENDDINKYLHWAEANVTIPDNFFKVKE